MSILHPRHFLRDCFDPNLDKRKLSSLRSYGESVDVHISQICLMEHETGTISIRLGKYNMTGNVRIVVEAK
jgi:hypothetical protein